MHFNLSTKQTEITVICLKVLTATRMFSIKKRWSLQTEENPDWFDGLIQDFFNGTETRLLKLRDAIEQGDSKQIKVIAHTIKGACYQFGAYRMSNLSEKLEQDAEVSEMSADEQKDLIGKIEREFLRVRQALEAFQVRTRK
jgi:HPt (histidine-containing phosphotransfer) domain-containing protein